MQRKYFGTDGVRGKVGEFPIIPSFVMKLGWAAGKVLSEKGTKKVIIGKDTRISGYMLEAALEAGFSAAGVKSVLLGPMPTPAIAYLTRAFRAEAGVVISASHNPFYDNGIKFFSKDGTKLPDEIESKIEELLDEELTVVEPQKLGKASRKDDAPGRYIEFCKGSFPNNLNMHGLRIVLDCAHGATYQVAPSVFSELGAEVIAIGNTPDGININDGYGSTHPDNLIAKVLQTRADLGIAFDGDGDRVMMVDKDGILYDGDVLLYIIAKHQKENNKLVGGVVGTLMSNLGLEQALGRLQIPFERAKVGDRYVMEKLLENGWFLGGENSGHIISLRHTTTGDGIISALQVIRAMCDSGKSLKELTEDLVLYPQVLKNVRLTAGFNATTDATVQDAVAKAESKLGDKGRVLLRNSGTEPLVRVMVEGEDEELVNQLATKIADVIIKQSQD
ncbi:MAG: phosphoglucosamine mutase [Succinivibrionaceae bacterium]|nr:phosphoglucosamine mutase [Ruminobacter sp.]MDY5778727.1 phosphoglucosamine mutase [Succinivibrionaceae bacterium]MEE1340297.1 phosphoglucosamine mutase [Succinivibrionaceae bacterium]